MNPLAKALGSILVLAASALGTSLGHGGLPFGPQQEQGAGSGDGNQTADGNSTGNHTAGGNSTTPHGNSTGGSGNQTSGNQTSGGGNQTAGGNATAGSGNETTDDGDDGTDDAAAPQCTVAVDDGGGEIFSGHHEWSWLVTRDVTHLEVDFDAYDGVGLGLHDTEVRLEDGQGRVLAHSESGSAMLHVDLGAGGEYLSTGEWRLLYDGGGVFSDYYAHVALNC